jgi:hypothetical protein
MRIMCDGHAVVLQGGQLRTYWGFSADQRLKLWWSWGEEGASVVGPLV